MAVPVSWVAAASGPGSNAAFYVLVALHVLSALTGFASVGFAGTYLARAARALSPGEAGPGPAEPEDEEELQRYFARPARLWWALLGVPVFGASALAVQPHGGGFDQLWALCALVVWLAAVALTARVILPGLHHIGRLFAEVYPPRTGEVAAAAVTGTGREAAAAQTAAHLAHKAEEASRASRAALAASRAAMVCDGLFVIALALMIWQPN